MQIYGHSKSEIGVRRWRIGRIKIGRIFSFAVLL
jgi:hypothetical protein